MQLPPMPFVRPIEMSGLGCDHSKISMHGFRRMTSTYFFPQHSGMNCQ